MQGIVDDLRRHFHCLFGPSFNSSLNHGSIQFGRITFVAVLVELCQNAIIGGDCVQPCFARILSFAAPKLLATVGADLVEDVEIAIVDEFVIASLRLDGFSFVRAKTKSYRN